MRVTVIGAGIQGSAIAYRLARGGAEVTLADRNAELRGATWASFGWINAQGKQPESYFELNRAGIRASAELGEELADRSWLHGGGSLEIEVPGDPSDELVARAERQAAAGYRSMRLTLEELRGLEPGMAVDSGQVGAAVLFQDEGWIDTERLVACLRTSAGAAGAQQRLGSAVTRIAGGSAVRVETATADGWDADLVVNAAGPDATDVARLAGGQLPSTAGPPGLTVVTDERNYVPLRVVRWPGFHVRPHAGGRVMVGANGFDQRIPAQRDPDADTALARDALVEAAAALPDLVAASVDSARVSRRAVPPDGFPVVGADRRVPWLYHLVSHSGVTLAALLSRLAADEILHGRADERLAAYRPARFGS